MHGGLYSGFSCSITRFPEDDTCIISLYNINDTSLSDEINREIIKMLFAPEVSIHGIWMDLINRPIFSGDNMLFPADELAASLNSIYQWDEKNKRITISQGETVIEMRIDSQYAIVNQKSVELPIAALMENVPFVPAEFICDTLGFQFEYDRINCVAIIN